MKQYTDEMKSNTESEFNRKIEWIMMWAQHHPVTALWALIFIIFNIVGLVITNINISGNLLADKNPEFINSLIQAVTGVYSLIAVLPAGLWLMFHYPIRLRNILWRLPLHFFASIVIDAGSIFLMSVFRLLIYRGNYADTNMLYRYFFEYNKMFIVYWTTYVFVQMVKVYWQWQQDKLRKAQLESELTTSQLHALQRQLNPHFLFNTLNLISSTMRKNVEAADNMLTYLSDLLRVTLDDKNADIVLFGDEIKHLELYLRIMRARFKDSLNVTLDIDSQTGNVSVPGFILQPLVENSILHCMDVVQMVEIKISAHLHDSRMHITVTDNGLGIDNNTITEGSKGIGLRNVRGLLDNVYGSNYELELTNKPGGGLIIIIIIPIKIDTIGGGGNTL